MIAKLVNLALLGLYPIAWQMPLASAEVAWLFTTDQISIFSGIADLWDSDRFLCIVVAFFAVVAPYCKTLALVYAQFSDTQAARRMLPAIELLGRLSMTDVFLVAFYIIAYRGIGDIVIEDGLYLFTGLVIASILAGWLTKRQMFHSVPRAPKHPPISLSQGAEGEQPAQKRLPQPRTTSRRDSSRQEAG